MKPAPKPNTGEAIELEPLKGKAVAVRVNSKREVETKFGKRELAEVTMLIDGQTEALEGVLFQSYFTRDLAIGEFYAGVIAKTKTGDFERWYLDYQKLSAKQKASLEKLIENAPPAPPF